MFWDEEGPKKLAGAGRLAATLFVINLRILHISDLHASSRDDWDQRRILAELLDDIQPFQEQRPVDLVVFTGDLAFSGKPEDYGRAHSLLTEPLGTKLALQPDRFVLVPGNHDVDRDRIDEFYEAGLAQKLSNREALNDYLLTGNIDAALDRLAAWNSFTETFYKSAPRRLLRPMGWTTCVEIDGIAVGIAALNSAWRSSGSGDAERGRLLLGEPQVHEALASIQGAGIRIVAMHHPLSWMQKFDHDDSRVQLERSGALVLTGHEHESDPSMAFTTRGSAIYGRVGCLYQTRNYRNSFAIIDIDQTASTASFNLREWVDMRHTFDVGVTFAERGTLTVPLPRRFGDSPAALVPYTRVTAGLIEIAQHSTIVGDLIRGRKATAVSDLIVPPRLYPVPYSEVVGARVAAKGKKITKVDPLPSLAETHVVIISGEQGAGVTDSLLWLIDRQFSTDGTYLPLYSRFDPRQGKTVIDQDLREAAARISVQVGPDEPLPKAVIAIDDVTAASDRALARLVNYIEEHPQNRYVLGCHGDHHRPIEEALAKIDVRARRLFLGPFGRREMKQVAANLAGVNDGSLPDRVLDVLVDKGLPRTPFLMATLMAVLLRQPDTVVLNATAIIDAQVNLLLGEMDLPVIDAMDFRGRQHLLEHIAGEFTRAGKYRMERLEVERTAIKYFENRRLRGSSPGRVLDDLIARRILIEDGDDMGFRHPTLQHLFAARLMRDDQGFADQVRSEPLLHSEIIQHAAALSRADAELLALVDRAVKPVIDERTQAVAQASIEVLLLKTQRRSVDLNNLDQILKQAAPPTDEVVDAVMDEFWEGASDRASEPRDVVRVPEVEELLLASTILVSEVLVTSELVADIPLRVEVLKDAIRGWSSTAIELLKREEERGDVRKLVEIVIFSGDVKPDQRTSIDRLVRAIVLFSVALSAVGALGKRQTHGLISDLVADEEFMATAMHALMTTLLAVFLKAPRWPELLVRLHDEHGDHPFVADFAHDLALNRFEAPTTSEADAVVLKRFLVDDIIARSKTPPSGVEERQRLKSRIDSQLRIIRTRVKLRGLPDNLLAGDDDDGELPVEDDDVDSEPKAG